MNIVVQRFEFGSNYTIGKLFINGVEQCFTLEREVIQSSDASRKPAIPEGQYHTVIDFSQRFQRPMPHLLNVPGYEGIRIHMGNTDANTEGCILLGNTWTQGDWIGNSVAAFNAFFETVEDQGDFVVTVTSKEPTLDDLLA